MAIPPVETDAAGRFDLRVIPLGKYLVVAENAHLTGAMAWIDLRDRGVDPEHLVLVVHDCVAVLHGTVYDASGGPIAGARVARTEDGITLAAEAHTDASGNYELCTLPGESGLIAAADGYAQVTTWVTATGRLRRDFWLAPEAAVAGRVVRADDQSPVASALVTLQPETASLSPVILHATTDGEGRFHISGAAVGRHIVSASAHGLVSRNPVVVHAEVGTLAKEVICEVVPSAHVRGAVLNAGKGVVGARVVLTPRGSARSWVNVQAVTQADGTFEIDDVSSGEYVPSVEGYALMSGRSPNIKVDESSEHHLTIEVEKLASISGRITRNGESVDGAQVRAGSHSAVSNSDGYYQLAGLPAGTYAIYAESSQTQAFSNGPNVTVLGGEQKSGVDINLDLSASIAGTVLDQDGAPVSGVLISFSLLRGRDFGTATTAEDGTFRTTPLAGGGEYTYAVRPNSYSRWPYDMVDGKRPATLLVKDAQSQLEGVVIRIKRDQYSIHGRVVNAKGEPLPDVAVRLAVSDELRDGSMSSNTDVTGAFTIRELQMGFYVLRATSARGDVLVNDIAAGSTDVVIRIPEPAGIAGTLEGFRVPPEVFVLRSDRDSSLYRGNVRGTAFEIDAIPPGVYDLTATSADGFDSTRLTVAEGTVSNVVLHRHAYGSISGRVLDADTRQPRVGAKCDTNRHLDGAEPALTDSFGRFRLEGILAGEVSVVCSDADTRTSAMATVVPGGLTEVELVARAKNSPPRSYAGLHFEGQLGDAFVKSVDPDGPADRAGFKVGDMLSAIDGRDWRLFGGRPLEKLEQREPGTTVKIKIERLDKTQTLTLMLAPPH
jgi:protocatechuate 3,4-dioxygenase beta subunit